jgi:ornithine cyclodeaminase/alanine dehydrogenase-like protein (mu-crystallin family)
VTLILSNNDVKSALTMEIAMRAREEAYSDLAREDARAVGMIGSGGMARSHAESFLLARKIERIQVYSPTKAHRRI